MAENTKVVNNISWTCWTRSRCWTKKTKDSQKNDWEWTPFPFSFNLLFPWIWNSLCALFSFSQHLKFDWMGEVPILKEKQNQVEPVKWENIWHKTGPHNLRSFLTAKSTQNYWLADNCQILAVRSDICKIGQLSDRTTVSADNCQIGQLSVRTTVSGDNCQ